MKFLLPLILSVSSLIGCTTTQPAGTVAATEIALTTAESLAFHYATLPTCPTAAPACSDPAVVARIKAADNTAYAAVKAARAATAAGNDNGTVAAASAAVAALNAAIPHS